MSATANSQQTSPLAKDLANFLTDRQARGLSPRSIEFYTEELAPFVRWAEGQGVTETLALTPDHLRQYLVALSQRRSPGGVLCAYRALSAFLRWYEAEYEPPGWRNPIRKVKRPKVPQEPLEAIPLEHIAAMVQTCRRRTFGGDRDRAIILTLLDTGMRASEFVALNVGDVDLETGAILVQQGKGRKPRTVFVGAKARQALQRYLARRRRARPDAPLWVGREGQRLSYWGLRQIMRRRAARAGVPAPSLHGFRRTFALLALRGGMDIYSLQRLMGHAGLSVLRRYLAMTEGDLRAAHERASPVDNLL